MIPDYQTLMLPLLETLADGKPWGYRDLIEALAERFGLSAEERRTLLPSGKQPLFDNRVGWAKTYLKKAGLVVQPQRAVVQISAPGEALLATAPQRIDLEVLRRYPAFVAFQSLSHTNGEEAEGADQPGGRIFESGQTPEEQVEGACQDLRKALAQEILARVLALSPSAFEQLVVDLMLRMGYGGSMADAGRAIGQTNDEGIDGTIREDRLGLDMIYLQAKRWQPGQGVGRPELQKFVGALAGQGAKKGVFITTSHFTREARDYAPRNETRIVLIDGNHLAELMIDFGLGCTTSQTFEIKKIDNDYFSGD